MVGNREDFMWNVVQSKDSETFQTVNSVSEGKELQGNDERRARREIIISNNFNVKAA